jgi:hypothetical protein
MRVSVLFASESDKGFHAFGEQIESEFLCFSGANRKKVFVHFRSYSKEVFCAFREQIE